MKYILLFSMFFCLSTISAQTVDSVAMKQVDSLIILNRDLVEKKQFEDALVVIEKAEKLTLSVIGRQSATMGNCLHNHARTFQYWGRNKDAELFYLEAIAIREKVLGKEHPDYANSLNNLANVYFDLGNFEKAELFYLESKSIWEKVLGKENSTYAYNANSLAIVYSIMGKYDMAEPLFLEVKAIWEKVVGREHPDYASSINNLGILYRKIGAFEKAEPFCIETKAIREKVQGKEHPDYANSLINLGVLYKDLGNFEKAEPLYQEAKAIKEKLQEKEHPDYAGLLYNLANLYLILGQYEKAEPLYMEAKAIMQKVLGKEHPEYAMCLNNLADFYRQMGNYEKAEPLYIESLSIREKVFGKEHPDYAACLSNLAILYHCMGHNQKSEMLFLEAKAIKGEVIGKEHSDYANTLNDLAILYIDMGNYQMAELLYLESRAIREKVQGKEHPHYARTLNNLGDLYRLVGNYEQAETFYLESKAICERVLGKDHQLYISCLKNLGILYELQNRYVESEQLKSEYFERYQTRLIQSSSFLSEQELSRYVSTFQKNEDEFFTQMYIRLNKNVPLAALETLSYDNAMFIKGFLLNAVGQIRRLSHTDSVSVEKFNQLKRYRRLLASEYSKPIKEQKRVNELEEKANTTEKEMVSMIIGYTEASKQVKWKQVQKLLSSGEAAIEFINFNPGMSVNSDSTMYAALILKSGINPPIFIPLFEENELNYLLSTDNERKADYVNHLYSWADRGLVKLGSEKKSLYELIWEKIEAKGLEEINTIYYSPSGILHRLNLGAIAVDEETILSDRYNMIALNSTRQLVIPAIVNAPANSALLVGGVNFEADTLQSALEEIPLISSRSSVGIWSEAGTRGGSWSSLTWTGKEVERISTTLTTSGFSTTQYTGVQATEEAIKAIGSDAASPRILHIATHGFFFPDPKIKTQGIELLEAEPVFKSSDNPMIRSGLILAGGNYAWQHGKATEPDKEDGILTAYEISQMNLSNTELVVLSACETGLGDIQGNEGVYGLQRAFKIAGAKYLIMSLWQVPDRETMEFMTTFYKNWLEEKLTIPDAFRKTQREMRDRFFNPYSWAAFVLVE